MLTCYCLAEMGMGIGPSVAIGLAVGCLAGLGNGLLVSRLYMNSLIATLGTMFVLVGFLYMVTGGQSIMMLPESYTDLGAGPQWMYFAQGALLLAAILLNYYAKIISFRIALRNK